MPTDISQLWVGLPSTATVIEQPAQADATPGTNERASYRVRVGKRWMRVDPLDPQSLRAAMVAAAEQAEMDAQDASNASVAPQKAAAKVVAASTAKTAAKASGVDYAAYRAESQRIALQVREVYAQAMQRELIARLMQEDIERDEDESLLLLLG